MLICLLTLAYSHTLTQIHCHLMSTLYVVAYLGSANPQVSKL